MRDYIVRTDDGFRLDRRSARKIHDGTLHTVILTSQRWQGYVWEHRLDLFIPDRIEFPDFVLMTIGSDRPVSLDATQIDFEIPRQAGMIYAYLYDIPNQPLFDGLREDELIAHTMTQYLETDDSSWPLLFPMVKGAVRAMDAIRSFCGEEELAIPQRFILHGASKRGWTSWLTPVCDPRVAAIVPEVYDNLNLFVQMPHRSRYGKNIAK